jgi:hypothetical protein
MSFTVPTQESARRTLDQLLGVAVSRQIPDEQRRELGLAISWLQKLVDCGVLAGIDSRDAVPDLAGDGTETTLPSADARKVA